MAETNRAGAVAEVVHDVYRELYQATEAYRTARTDDARDRAVAEYETLVDLLPAEQQRYYRGRIRNCDYIVARE
jgi:hypothetical protein